MTVRQLIRFLDQIQDKDRRVVLPSATGSNFDDLEFKGIKLLAIDYAKNNPRSGNHVDSTEADPHNSPDLKPCVIFGTKF